VALLWGIVRVWYGLKVVGRENLISASGPIITVSNHVAALDCGMIASAQLGRRFAFTSLASNFRLPVAGFFVRHLGCVPVPSRGNDEERAVFAAAVAERLRWVDARGRGWVVHFFPEGALRPYSAELGEFRHGAFTVACQNNVPVVPVVITWHKAGPLRRLLRRKPRAVLTIHPPIHPLGPTPKDAQALAALCRAAMCSDLRFQTIG